MPRKKLETTTQEVDASKLDLEIARKLLNISKRATEKNLEFNLTFDYVKQLLSYKTCFYTNVSFIDEEGSMLSRSFDRKDNSKGYIIGNIGVCTVDFNRRKGDLSLDEIKLLYEKLIK